MLLAPEGAFSTKHLKSESLRIRWEDGSGKSGRRNGSIDLKSLYWIHVHKTSMLLKCSVVCGAIIGGGSEERIERTRRYAHHVSLLFQVVDDIRDVARSSEELGKTARKDLSADNATYTKLMQ
ncbi:hypothetical protein KI387_028014 [Taxus chinensis]|uniref:Uncharacterized protein n=1 Tax=Taxus chinensis TaxID=29808 RepID=A0AA38L3M9_TAXCH|nr:hypothetical protein KI387_028014 [Taxus chinensis]